MDALTITNLTKRFGDKTVLDKLNLSVPEHSIFGFIGKNGAGKTTAMKTILGLLKPDGGQITVAGERVAYGQTKTNRNIGYLPDVPEFYPYMTPYEYLVFCGKISEIPEKELKVRCLGLLELVGLKNENHRIKGFSRGMKQRLGIAQAMNRPPPLILPEERKYWTFCFQQKNRLPYSFPHISCQMWKISARTPPFWTKEALCCRELFLNCGASILQKNIFWNRKADMTRKNSCRHLAA